MASTRERPMGSSDPTGDRVLALIQETRDAAAAHQHEVARLNVAAPLFSPLVKSGRKAKKAFADLRKFLTTAVIKLKKSEELRKELTLERAYRLVGDANRQAKTAYDGFVIRDKILKVDNLVIGAYNELPSLLSLNHAQTHLLRTCWVYTGVTLYRAAIQPSRFDRARIIFRLLAAQQIDDHTAYFLACALNSTSQTSDYMAPKLRSCLLELLLLNLTQLEQRYAVLMEILLKLQARAPSDHAEAQKDALSKLLGILAADLGRPLCQRL